MRPLRPQPQFPNAGANSLERNTFSIVYDAKRSLGTIRWLNSAFVTVQWLNNAGVNIPWRRG